MAQLPPNFDKNRKCCACAHWSKEDVSYDRGQFLARCLAPPRKNTKTFGFDTCPQFKEEPHGVLAPSTRNAPTTP